MILSNYAIKFRTAVFVFILVLVIAGGTAYKRLPREGMPDITIPFVFVTAFYEGTSPEEMEKLITIPLEKQINDAENIKEIRTVSAENITSVSIEFEAGEDIEQAKQRVKDKVDLARPDLPTDLDAPIVDAFNFSSDFPVFIFALSGSTSRERLKSLGEDLQDQIEALSGVKEAVLTGIREREIRVELDLPGIIARKIPLGLVLGRIAGENRTISAGNIDMDGDKFQLRIPGEFTMVPDLGDILLTERAGQPIYLRDVARVRDTTKENETISRLNGVPCISVSIKKRSGVNAVGLIASVTELLDGYALPPGIELTVVSDQSEEIKDMISELENNIASGFILVLVILLLFLGVRNSIFVALAIPLSMLTAFTVLGLAGATLNMVVLFTLVLSVGMLVDNAIVIVENIYRNRSDGMSRIEAARRGAAEVAWPVITSTATTCAAFAPLMFWPGIMGQFMGFLPRTLIIVLAASLFVGIVINPAVCSALISGAKKKKPGAEKKIHPFVQRYERLLRAALRHRVVVLLLGLAFLVLSVQLYGRFGRGVELFPSVAPRNASVSVNYPQGTSIEQTDAALREIEAKLPAFEDVEFYLTTVGAGGDMFSSQAAGHLGNVLVMFVDAADRKENSYETVNAIRDAIGTLTGAEIKVAREEEGPPAGGDIQVELSGDDFDILSDLAGEIQRRIVGVPGLADVEDDLEEALPELQFQVDRDRAALLGLDTDAIGGFLRMAVYGLETTKFRADEEEFDVTVRLPKARRNSAALLDEIFIPVPGGEAVPLSSLGDVVYTGGRGAINRKDQKRVVTITGADTGRGVDKILFDVKQALDDLVLPRGYQLEYAGKNKEMNESGLFLARAFAVAIGLILVILVVQFNSPVLPLIIVFSVILSLIGVMWGLLLCNMRFGVIMTGVGVISLAGIVVNNAIVLIDCIIQRRAEGCDATEAVVAAGRLRLRPVLLTAVTTILGLIPMAVGYSLEVHEWPPRLIAGAESSAWWAPMAVAVIFGLALATVLTLLLVPVMYSLFDSLVSLLRKGTGVGMGGDA